MKNIKFNYYDLKNDKVLLEVSYVNREYFIKNFNKVWKYKGIKFELTIYKHCSEGAINLSFGNEGKLLKVEIFIGTEITYSIIPKKYVYIFEDLEEKVYNIKEKNLFDILNIKIKNNYYYICYDNFYKNFFIREDCYYDNIDDVASEVSGNVFKTKEEAEEFIKELEKLFIERKQKLLKVG